MSGIVGVFHLSGRPVAALDVEPLLRTIAIRGPDGSHTWTSGPIGLGHCLLATTPESAGERQPHHSRDGRLSIVLDGRIDNREELAEEFARARLELSTPTDAAYVLAAYRLWGVDCPARVLGDFAFGLWDEERRRLFCARDILGLKPLYYHHGPDVFLFASQPQALVRHPAVSRRPNEGMVGEYLSVVTSVSETVLADVQRLPPAHRIAVSPRGALRDRYWQIDPAREVRYRTVEGYCEHLRALLDQVVRARLRCSTDVGVLLSGGVDSSTVLAVATELKRRGAVTVDCHAFSLVDPGGPIDESPFIERVVHTVGCPWHPFPIGRPPVDAYHAITRFRADLASAPNARALNPVRQAVRQQGVRVLLSGIWGDEWFCGSYYQVADLFWTLRWSALAERIRSASKYQSEIDLPPGPTVKFLTWPLLPRAVRARIKKLIGRDGIPPWVDRTFAKRIALDDRLYPSDPDQPFPTIAQRSIYRDMTSAVTLHCVEDEERTAAEFGFDLWHPFADRRIVEFGMAIPEDMRWRDGTRKFVLREAMRDRLPAEVRLRRTSPNGGPLFVPTLRALAEERSMDEAAIAREGFVDVAEVRRLYDSILTRQAAGDGSYSDDVWPMWMVSAVELWMREVADT